MIATASWCSIQQAECWYRLLTADQVTGSDPSICFAVTSRALPPKEKKSIRELVMFKDKKWYTRLFIGITSETLCDEGVNKVVLAHI
jgi:hypothetical protein